MMFFFPSRECHIDESVAARLSASFRVSVSVLVSAFVRVSASVRFRTCVRVSASVFVMGWDGGIRVVPTRLGILCLEMLIGHTILAGMGGLGGRKGKDGILCL